MTEKRKGDSLKLLGVALLVLMTAFVVAGCAQEAAPQEPATGGETAGTTSPDPAEEEVALEPVELIVPADGGGTSAMVVEFYEPWLSELKDSTDGLVTYNIYHSNSLVASEDRYDAIVSGVADLSLFRHNLTPEFFPLTGVLELPMLSATTSGKNTKILQELYAAVPEMQEEHGDLEALAFWSSLPLQLHTIGQPVRTADDIRGLRLASPASPGVVNALEAWGAAPVPMRYGEYYMSLERGVVDGAVIPWGALGSFSLYEVVDYHTQLNLASMTYVYAMNKETWERLSPIHDMIHEMSEQVGPMRIESVEGELEEYRARVLEQGNEIIELTPEERRTFTDEIEPLYEEWIENMEQRGLPGRKVFEEAVRIVEANQ